MPLVSMRQLLDHAAEHGYGLPAFNVNNLEQVRAIMEAADEVDAPVIMQGSAGARKYAGEAFLRHLIQAAIEAYPHIPVVMHQDHGQSPAVCMAAIRSGFSSVMMDGSLMEDGKTPSSYEYNVETSRKVVDFSHAIGVTVEAELGVLGSLETMKGDKEDGHGAEGTMTREQLLTDPDQAADFVQKTQCDALAIAIGTSHGAYKFTRKPTGDILAIQRIKEIHARIPNTHLVMHGSSSVPQEWLAIINEYGGNMGETYVPAAERDRPYVHRDIAVAVRYGEQAELRWRNSLFNLDVTEVYRVRKGLLVLDQVTFADPRGLPPPQVTPADVDDLYHTGGPFTARGLGKSFARVVYRVGEIGNPRLAIMNRTVALKDHVGFGGAVVVTTELPGGIELLQHHLRRPFAAY